MDRGLPVVKNNRGMPRFTQNRPPVKLPLVRVYGEAHHELVFYRVTGGVIASVHTNVLQGPVMMVAGFLILITAMQTFDGSLREASEIVLADDGESMMPVLAIGLNWKRATTADAVAFVTSLVLFFGVSFATPRPLLARDIDRVLEI